MESIAGRGYSLGPLGLTTPLGWPGLLHRATPSKLHVEVHDR